MNEISKATCVVDCISLVEEQKKKLKELSTMLSDLSNTELLPSIKIIPGNIPMMTTQAEALLINETGSIYHLVFQS
jgi:hypothetical protein